MNRARSIKQNSDFNFNSRTYTLPNFRRIGTVLRIVLMVNGFALLSCAAESLSWADWLTRIIQLAAWLQPLLLCSLLLLYGLNTWLSRLPYWRGTFLVALLTSLLALALAQLGDEIYFHEAASAIYINARDALVSFIVSWLLLAYFRWREQALSPARQGARLQALQARIRPHFLFNSINAVLSIVRSQPKRAETALEDMADLFRMAMLGEGELVTLSQEIKLAKQYLALEKLRLGERLQVAWQLPELSSDVLIPPLILQPLLENAVYHGIELLADAGVIRVEIKRVGKSLLLMIENPLPATHSHTPGNRLALMNIRERLALQFDVEARYKVEQSATSYRVLIELPYLEKESL